MKLSAEELMVLICSVGEDSWESLARRSNQSILKEISPEYSLEGLMLKLKLQYFGHLLWRADSWERPWCWETLKAGGEGDDRGWDGWMASPAQWTWVWVDSGSWWWTGRPGVLRFMGLQRVRHDWVTELNWSELFYSLYIWHLTHFCVCCWRSLCPRKENNSLKGPCWII